MSSLLTGVLMPVMRGSFGDLYGISEVVSSTHPSLSVFWNPKVKRYEVHDRAAPGGLKWSFVMRVQEPSGEFRPLDQRVLETLAGARRPATLLLKDIEAKEEKQELARDKDIRDFAEGAADDLRWFGRQVTPSVAWRERSIAREQIREEAKH